VWRYQRGNQKTYIEERQTIVLMAKWNRQQNRNILWKGSAGSIMYGSDLKLKTICVTINTYTCKYTSKIYTSEESNKICN
jgi:hypothetical protein